MYKYSGFPKLTQGGVYYGGTVAGPVMNELLSNILPYMGIEPVYTEQELELESVKTVTVPNVTGLGIDKAKKLLSDESINYILEREGETVKRQLPPEGQNINSASSVILYTE